MPQDGIKRVNICFPKDDTTTLQIIDEVRGNMSRSQAIQRMLEYLTASGKDWLKDLIKQRYRPQNTPIDTPITDSQTA